jgi:hypothetical protein
MITNINPVKSAKSKNRQPTTKKQDQIRRLKQPIKRKKNQKITMPKPEPKNLKLQK